MPKIPYKPEKTRDKEDDYEIVSFEDFCDKSPGSKTDLLSLNDNINYRLHYEGDKASRFLENEGECSKKVDDLLETSLSGPKQGPSKRKMSATFAPFGRYNAKQGREPLFSGVIPKPKNDDESPNQHRYQRFSSQRNIFYRMWDHLPGFVPTLLLILLVTILGVSTWWISYNTMGGQWGEEHYRRLWERAHPENVKQPLVPSIPFERVDIQEHAPRYHDHNNLSTKNKNTTDKKKIEYIKKNEFLDLNMTSGEVCANVSDNMRFDCYPQDGASEKECQKRGCCWLETTTKGAPFCFYPPNYRLFRFTNMTENKHGMSVYYERETASGYPGDFDVVRLDVKYLTDEMLQIKISDAENKRWEPPYPEIPTVPGPISNRQYRVQVNTSTLGFTLLRNDDDFVILDTQNVGGMILSDKFLQLSAALSTQHMYGLGEKRARFMLDQNWKTYSIFNRDGVPVDNANGYGSHPFYLALEPSGKSHGVSLLNSNAIDIVLQPNGITYRTIGGIINMFVMLGPSPSETVSQYTGLIGRPFMPPYWSLGFHLCKYNYGSLNVTEQVWKSNREAGIPFDVQWNDLDYMDKGNDFTYDHDKFAKLPQFVKELHNSGMHYVVLIDVGVSAGEKPGSYPPYDRGLEMDIFIKNSTDQPFIGKVWNRISTAFPDFTHPNSSGYWLEMMTDLHKQIKYDGAWIDMNEPSNFPSAPLQGSCDPEVLPYKPRILGANLRDKTICMESKHYVSTHYDVHNMYALTEAIATNFALTEIRGLRPFIISRASFVGIGRVAGHWSGDINSSWEDMKMSIPEMLDFSLFGVPMMGSDICGFNGDTTPELCLRWMQLGAFYPFSRNHNSDTSKPQDPVSLGPAVVSGSVSALRVRYSMLPYLYALFWKAHVYGETVARPLFFEFVNDSQTYDIDTQFLWGGSVMVTPILEPGETRTRAYFPGHWVSFRTGGSYAPNKYADVGENDTVSIRAGSIIPLQEPVAHGPVTTTNSRSAPIQLFIAPDPNNRAGGEIYWDDGDSLNSYEEKKYSHVEFYLKSNEVASNVTWWGIGVPTLNKVTVTTQPAIKSVSINGDSCQKPKCEFKYYETSQILEIYNINLPLDKPFNIKWIYNKKGMKKQPKNSTKVCVDKDCSLD